MKANDHVCEFYFSKSIGMPIVIYYNKLFIRQGNQVQFFTAFLTISLVMDFYQDSTRKTRFCNVYKTLSEQGKKSVVPTFAIFLIRSISCSYYCMGSVGCIIRRITFPICEDILTLSYSGNCATFLISICLLSLAFGRMWSVTCS